MTINHNDIEFIRVLWGENLRENIFTELKYCVKYEKQFNTPRSKFIVYGEDNYNKVKTLTDNEVILLDKDPRPFRNFSHWFLKIYAIQQSMIMFNKPIIFLDLDTFHEKPIDEEFFKYFSGKYYGNFRDSFQMPVYFLRQHHLAKTHLYHGKFGNRGLNASFIYCRALYIINIILNYYKKSPAHMNLTEEFIITLLITEMFGDLETTDLQNLVEPEVIKIYKGIHKTNIYLSHHPNRRLAPI